MSRKTQNFFAIILISVCTFYTGYYFGRRGFEVDIKRNPPSVTILNKEPQSQSVDFEKFWIVWDSLNKNHINRPLDSNKLLYGAISGAVAAVGDDYTSFFNPDQNKLAKSSLNGVYEGIGAELGFKDKQLVVISPIEGSPAYSVGIRPQDKVLEIDGKSTLGINLGDAVSQIRGAAGTIVTLKIQRREEDPKDYKITRGKIVSRSVKWEDLGNGIGYLRLSRFGDSTISDWTAEVSAMRAQMPNLKGVVLDVRGNPGGYLQSSIYIASEFIPKGVVLYEERADGTVLDHPVDREGHLIGIPVVVLVDGGSASASEIVAAALRDNLGSKLVGVKSFGKGTIQNSEEFKDGSSLHVTVAKWLTPNRNWIHGKGLEPDVIVERKEEDVLNDIDPQLEKAKEMFIYAK